MIDQTLIIIPTYNEALNIKKMIEALFNLYPEINILIIDDNSPDKTADVVSILSVHHSRLHLIKRAGKLGLGSAYLEGFNWALKKDFKYISQMDCDFSHDPADVKKLLQALTHADLAIGSRYSENKRRTKNWPLYRLLLSLCASSFLRLFTGMKIKDISGGFKAFKKETLQKINLDNIISKGFVFQFEITYKIHSSHLHIQEVPIIFHQRALGASKMSIGIFLEALKVFVQLRWRKFMGTLN